MTRARFAAASAKMRSSVQLRRGATCASLNASTSNSSPSTAALDAAGAGPGTRAGPVVAPPEAAWNQPSRAVSSVSRCAAKSRTTHVVSGTGRISSSSVSEWTNASKRRRFSRITSITPSICLLAAIVPPSPLDLILADRRPTFKCRPLRTRPARGRVRPQTPAGGARYGQARWEDGRRNRREPRHRRRDRAGVRRRGRPHSLRGPHAARGRAPVRGLARNDGRRHPHRRRRSHARRRRHLTRGRVREAHRRRSRRLRPGRRAREQRRAHVLLPDQGVPRQQMDAVVGGQLPRAVHPQQARARGHDRPEERRHRQHLIRGGDWTRPRTVRDEPASRWHLLRRREGRARAIHAGARGGGAAARRLRHVRRAVAGRADARHRAPSPRPQPRRPARRAAAS